MNKKQKRLITIIIAIAFLAVIITSLIPFLTIIAQQ